VLACDVYLHRLRALIAAMAAAMEGLDALVFTGGVGERASEIRRGATTGLRFLGVEVDADADADAVPDAEVSPSGASVRTLVLAAREDLEIAREVRATLHDAA
jgi:acetate kinase